MRTMAETVLRMKLTPDSAKEQAELVRGRSFRSGSSIIDEGSPIDVQNHSHRVVQSLQPSDPQRIFKQKSSRPHPLPAKLEQIEEERKSLNDAKNIARQDFKVEESKLKKGGNVMNSDSDEDESGDSSDTSSEQSVDDLADSDKS